MDVPPEILAEIEKDKAAARLEKENLPLNCVPGLRGKSNRQKFIIKVYSFLTIELFITFGFILITLCAPVI